MNALEILAVSTDMPAFSAFSCFKMHHHLTRHFKCVLTLVIQLSNFPTLSPLRKVYLQQNQGFLKILTAINSLLMRIKILKVTPSLAVKRVFGVDSALTN